MVTNYAFRIGLPYNSFSPLVPIVAVVWCFSNNEGKFGGGVVDQRSMDEMNQ